MSTYVSQFAIPRLLATVALKWFSSCLMTSLTVTRSSIRFSSTWLPCALKITTIIQFYSNQQLLKRQFGWPKHDDRINKKTVGPQRVLNSSILVTKVLKCWNKSLSIIIFLKIRRFSGCFFHWINISLWICSLSTYTPI